jgi:ribonuclease P protein component
VFDRLYRRARRYDASMLVLRVLAVDRELLPADQRRHRPSRWRCGVVVSTKVSKSAVRRNRLRRRLHAHLLALPLAPPSPRWLLLSVRPNDSPPDERRLLGECTDLLRQAGLLP